MKWWTKKKEWWQFCYIFKTNTGVWYGDILLGFSRKLAPDDFPDIRNLLAKRASKIGQKITSGQINFTSIARLGKFKDSASTPSPLDDREQDGCTPL